MTQHRFPLVISIPVKNEEARIGNCLQALSFQEGRWQYQIVLLLNNCTDRTAMVIKDVACSAPIPIRWFQVTLPPEQSNAGYARQLAMKAAEEFVAPGGVLLTTDADARVYPNWIAANLAALSEGADAVAGTVELDPAEARLIPAKLHEDDARECAYGALLDKIDARFDWDPADPWPRHTEHSGASIAVTLDAYRRAGGIPAVPLAEDRAFFTALRCVDAHIRHSCEVRVVVSGRIFGRAMGGMADTIRRRMVRPDDVLDEDLEPAFDAARRARIRKIVRTAWSNRDNLGQVLPMLSRTLSVPLNDIRHAFSLPYFGAAYAELEARSPILLKRRVPVTDLESETARAQAILSNYSPCPCEVRLSESEDPDGTQVLEAAAAD